MSPDTPGDTQFTQTLSAMIDSTIDMEKLIKDKFLFSDEKIQSFIDTNPEQATLREKVEELKKKIDELQEHLNQAQARIAESDKGSSDHTDNIMKQLHELENENNTLKLDLELKGRAIKELTAKRQELMKKNKQIEDRELKLSQNLKPRLQQAIENYRYLTVNFENIKKYTELLPMIFKAEAGVRQRATDQMIAAEQEAKEAREAKQQLEQRISNLEKDKQKAM